VRVHGQCLLDDVFIPFLTLDLTLPSTKAEGTSGLTHSPSICGHHNLPSAFEAKVTTDFLEEEAQLRETPEKYRLGSDRAHKTILQALRKECENLTFKPGEDVDDFALRRNTLQQKIVQFNDDIYSEERAVEKLFRYIPEKYKQITRSIESLLDLSMMSIEYVIGHLKVIDSDEPQTLSGPITVGGRLHLT
jgi:N12 class adenine-specific DNA methylase